MERIIDLHTHTSASDGSLSPAELVRHAKENGLYAVAITDHDTVEGIPEALVEGERIGIEVIPGVEIGVEFNPEMHILGYYFDESYLNIRETLLKLRKNREERNPKIISKLAEMGFDVSMDEVKREAAGCIVGRPHIAKVLAKKGYVKSVEEAFDKFLSTGRPAYFKKDKLSPEEGIRKIIETGGIPVLAHPIFLGMTPAQLDDLFHRLSFYGLRGIEAYYTDNTPQDTENLLKLARKHNFLVTGGSDFHGNFKDRIEIGKGYGDLRVPYSLLEGLKRCKKR